MFTVPKDANLAALTGLHPFTALDLLTVVELDQIREVVIEVVGAKQFDEWSGQGEVSMLEKNEEGAVEGKIQKLWRAQNGSLTPIYEGDLEDVSLARWIRRSCTGGMKGESIFSYRGAILTVHSLRGGRVDMDGRRMMLVRPPGENRYEGRGWSDRFASDVDEVIDILEKGGGEAVEPTLGALIRAEISLREKPDQAPRELEDLEAWQFLADDELKVFLGAWMHEVGILTGSYQMVRRETLIDFYPTNDEFEFGGVAFLPSSTWKVLLSLARFRRHVALEDR